MEPSNMPNHPKDGFFSKISEYFTELSSKLNLTRDTFIDIALYGGIGLIVGFLLRKYSGYVLLIIIGIATLLILAHYNIISITVHTDELQRLLGIQEVSVPDASTMTFVWEWVKANLLISISFMIGFILGLRLG